MSLLVGQSDLSYTLSTNLHYNMMFWLDEGLVEYGLFSTIQSQYQSTSDLRTLTKEDDAVYKFAVPRLVWQTGIQTQNGIAQRFSGIYVEGNYYANETSNYYVDYHNGYLYFQHNIWSDIETHYGNTPTIACSSYDTKIYYTVYNNEDNIRKAVNYITDDWENASFDRFDIQNPIICGGWSDANLRPYEMGGTKLTAVTYN